MMPQTSSKIERTDVKTALWRKKVDNTFFRYKVTTLPRWIASQWNLEKYFKDNNGFLTKKDQESFVKIDFSKKLYRSHITCTHPKDRANKVHRLWFPDEMLDKVKTTFSMSYMRDLESALRGDSTDIEKQIPFWEFVDIEFFPDTKTFKLTPHYVQEPFFPELFKRLSGSPSIKTVEYELFSKGEFRIHKQDWKPISELETEIGATNVIYFLINNDTNKIYIGEAEDLKKRLRTHFKLNSWTHYRYDKLPNSVNKTKRVALERMVIRSYASMLRNKSDVTSFDISNYHLENTKIDS